MLWIYQTHTRDKEATCCQPILNLFHQVKLCQGIKALKKAGQCFFATGYHQVMMALSDEVKPKHLCMVVQNLICFFALSLSHSHVSAVVLWDV
jgi:hypothetical protein